MFGYKAALYRFSVFSLQENALSNLKSLFSTNLVIPSTFSLHSWTLILGLAALTESISPLDYSLLNNGLFLTQIAIFIFYVDICGF